MKITKKHVMEWFKQRETGIVGQREEASSCPLATYIMDTNDNIQWVNVDGLEVEYENHQGRIYRKRLPAWAEIFVYRVDDGSYYKSSHNPFNNEEYDAEYDDLDYLVYGEEAVRILENV